MLVQGVTINNGGTQLCLLFRVCEDKGHTLCHTVITEGHGDPLLFQMIVFLLIKFDKQLGKLLRLGFITLGQIVDQEVFREVLVKLRRVSSHSRVVNLVDVVRASSSDVVCELLILSDWSIEIDTWVVRGYSLVGFTLVDFA